MVADAHVGRTDLVVRPVAVVHGLPPVARSLALQIVAEAAAFATRRGVHPGIVGQRSGKINIEDDVGIARPGRDLLRVADNERHAKRLLVHHALVEKAMLAEEITLVGDIDYDRILGQPLFIEETQQAADIVIDGRSATQVVANQLLIDFPARIFLTHSFYGKRQFRILAPPGIRVFRGDPPSAGHIFQRLSGERTPGFFRPELHHVCRFGERDSVINMFQPFGEIPRFVRRLEMATHHEGSVLVARTDPPDRLVGHQVGREALLHLAAFPFIIVYPALRGLEKRVPIFPLVMENRKGVETRRLRLEMPFAEKGRLIPSLLHAFRNIVQSRIEPVFKRIDPVMMAIGACHDSRAAGHGDRVRAKAVVKHAPLGRQAADILVLHVFAQYSSIDSPRLRGMIVGKDEKDVRASRVGFRLFVCHRRRGRRQKAGRDD